MTREEAFLVQDVTYYSKAALYDAFKAWRDGGPACSGRFDEKGAWKSTLTTRTTRYDQAGKKMTGVERVFDTKVFEGNVWGLQWFDSDVSPKGVFPQYFKACRRGTRRRGGRGRACRDAAAGAGVQAGGAGGALHFPGTAAWSRPGPKRGPFTVKLADGSVVTYHWYRFVDQPSFQQYALERGEEGEAAGLRGEDPCDLAHRPGLHGASQARRTGDARSGPARDAAQGP